MKIIITAAGNGSRFKNQGIKKEKYQIIANEKTLFYWSLISLKNFFEYEFIFIFQKENYEEEFVLNEIKNLGIKKYNILLLNQITDGQASTAIVASDLIQDNDPILIFNIDTHVNPKSLEKNILKHDGCIITTQVPGNNWSFAKTNDDLFVEEVSEKNRISNNASIGLYYFKKWKDFKDVYFKNKEDIKKKYKEVYICPMYQYLIESGKKISIFDIAPKNFICLGTPEQVFCFDKKWEKNNK